MSSTTTAPPARRPIQRPGQGRVLGGVAAGTGAALGVDPVAVRLCLVLLTLLYGTGLALYAVAWLALPDATSGRALSDTLARRVTTMPEWLRVALVVLAALVLTGSLEGGPGVFTGLVLVGLGILLFRGRTPAAATVPATPGAAAPPPRPRGATAMSAWPPSTSSAWPAPPAAPQGAAWPPPAEDPATAATARWPEPAIPAPPRQRPVLGRLTLAVALLSLGVLAVLDVAGPLEPTAQHYLGLLLTVLGAALVVGARWGVTRWPIVVGLLLLPVLLVVNLLGPAVGLVGEQWTELYRRPVSRADLAEPLRVGAGSLTLDLTQLNSEAAGGQTLSAAVGLGELRVLVPEGSDVVVDGAVRIGELTADGQEHVGTELSLRGTLDGEPGDLVLDLEVGAGALTVVEVERN